MKKINKENLNKKNLLNILFSRLSIFCILILLQFLFFIFVILFLSKVQVYVYSFLEIVSLLVVLWVLTKNENPSYKIAWVVVILSFPLFGGLFYLLWGNKRIGRVMQERINSFESYSASQAEKPNGSELRLKEENKLLARQANHLYNLSGFPVFQNTRAKYLEIGETYFKELKEELRRADKFIFLEYFIISDGEMWSEIEEILFDKVAKGVEIKVIYDDVGSIKTIPQGFAKRLRARGIEVTAFNPFRPRLSMIMNYRDHRKIAVIDGNVAFTGGINLADEYINVVERFGHWKDTGVMLQGSGVWNFTKMFLQLWQFSVGCYIDYDAYRPTLEVESDGYVQPFGDSPLDRLNVAENAYMQVINQATKYVYIMTPYLILDNEMVTSLCIAAQSGVDVRIMTPHIPDKWYVHPVTRSFYKPLLEAGVRIFEYKPGFVHAKSFVADNNVAIVGTTNMDFRSFYLHFECGVAFYNSSITKDIKSDFLKTQRKCLEVHKEDEDAIGFIRSLGRSLLKVFSPLM